MLETRYTAVSGLQTQVLVTGTIFDRLNTNASIRLYLFRALQELLGNNVVAVCPLELALDAVHQLRPKLIVAVGSLASDTSDLRRLRQAANRSGSRLAFWLHDDPYEFDYSYKCDMLADVVFSNDAWSVLHYNHPNVHHLPLAGAPEVHYRPLVPVADRDLTLFFCGVAYPNRISLFRQADSLLCRHPVAVLGAEWPTDIHCARNRRLSPAQMSDMGQKSRLTLNCGRDMNIANKRYALPPSTPGPRTFEIAQSGSAQLYVVSGLEILDYFEADTEIILIDSVKDIKIAIERSYDDPAGIEAIAARAQTRALREHSYADRARKMLAICDPAIVASRTMVA